MGFLFILLIIILFVAYMTNADVRREIDKSPGITWFGNADKKPRKKNRYGSDICSLSKKDKKWIDSGKWTDKWY